MNTCKHRQSARQVQAMRTAGKTATGQPFYIVTIRCRDCGHQFTERQEEKSEKANSTQDVIHS